MKAEVVSESDDRIVLQVTVELGNSMLETEEAIQESVNDVGVLATGKALERFDTDGSRIEIGGVGFTVRTRSPKPYQTPYGEVVVERYVYQTCRGGKVFVPLEQSARIIGTSTPRFAKMVSSKYAVMGANEVVRDLQCCNGRSVVRSYVKGLADMVGAIVEAKEESWSYTTPELDEPVSSVSIGLDGTTLRMHDGSYREAMLGTVALYSSEGERLHTIYIGAAPQYGKELFLERMEREIGHVKSLYPDAHYMGIADGARDNWPFLEQHTDTQLLDFFHASGYLHRAADSVYLGRKEQRAKMVWLEESHSNLKHKKGAAGRLLNEFRSWKERIKPNTPMSDDLESAITYFDNNKTRMNYYKYSSDGKPIGSGVTEAACKVIIKQRLCKSGMKWKHEGASRVIALRCLSQSTGRWEQFWDKVNRYGYNLAA